LTQSRYVFLVQDIVVQKANPTCQVLLWSQIELNLAIICSSIASLRPLFKSAFGGGGSGSRSGGVRYSPGGLKFSTSSQYANDLELVTKEGRERPNTKIEAQLHSMDNDSQEYILGKDDGIKRTIETSVTSEEFARERLQFRRGLAV
jgi:hypothetical protein